MLVALADLVRLVQLCYGIHCGVSALVEHDRVSRGLSRLVCENLDIDDLAIHHEDGSQLKIRDVLEREGPEEGGGGGP